MSTVSMRQRPEPRGSEAYFWAFMRISGVLLLFLALGHVAIMHLVGGGVERINFSFVASRWNNPLWRFYDWLLLSLALFHGVFGARQVLEDHVGSGQARALAKLVLFLAAGLLFLLGSLTVLVFRVPLGAGR